MVTGSRPAKKTTAAPKSTAKKPTAKKPIAKKSAAKSSTARRRTTTRRPQPALSTTIGSALGALVVTTLLDLSWPVRIALIVVVLLLGLGYLIWKNRSAIAAEAAEASGSDDGSAPAAAPQEGGQQGETPLAPAPAPPTEPS